VKIQAIVTKGRIEAVVVGRRSASAPTSCTHWMHGLRWSIGCIGCIRSVGRVNSNRCPRFGRQLGELVAERHNLEARAVSRRTGRHAGIYQTIGAAPGVRGQANSGSTGDLGGCQARSSTRHTAIEAGPTGPQSRNRHGSTTARAVCPTMGGFKRLVGVMPAARIASNRKDCRRTAQDATCAFGLLVGERSAIVGLAEANWDDPPAPHAKSAARAECLPPFSRARQVGRIVSQYAMA
jgi:hypothetical protein